MGLKALTIKESEHNTQLMVPKKEVITAVDLWKIYRLGRIEYPALRGVTLSVYEGEYIALVGPSGSGKSTLLNLFGALDRPTKGVVLIDGADISKLSDDRLAELRNRKLGFVFQNFNLIPYMTAEDNVELPLMASNIGIRERKRKAREVLAMVGLEGRESSRPSELSGGQQQRVAVARALVNDPKIILADEPTGNLDSKSSEEIIEILRMLNMNYGVSIVMVTHNLELTRYCHRIWYLRDGKIEREVVQNA